MTAPDTPHGWYYLHTNGELIWKRARPEMEAGGFVRKVWPCDPSNRGHAWLICIEALAMGASRTRVMALAERWGLTDDDAQRFMKNATDKGGVQQFKLFRDGDRWCAAFHDFVHVQTRQTGFGSTALEAFAQLAKVLR